MEDILHSHLHVSIKYTTFALDLLTSTQYDPTRVHRTGDSATLRRF